MSWVILARGFNRFLDSQRNMIGEVLTTSEQLRTAVGQWRGWWITPPSALGVSRK
jgi:methyl-accepting chemotaxis protein